MMRYFDSRSSKASAKKEVKFLSVIFNWARARGFMAAANPVTGTTRQMKIKEGRDIYVTDEMLTIVYACASPVIQDAIDLAYLTGQRPADVLKMRWDQVKDGSIWIEQGKTKARLQIGVVGELAALIERIKARGIVGMTLLCDNKGQQLKHSGYFRSQFKLARDRAEKRAAELGVPFTRFQFRDLRAKSASDMESMSGARKLLGHTTESMTAEYVRTRVGEKVSPVLISGYAKRDKT
jgi:integrase